jgi:hypothetical protein
MAIHHSHYRKIRNWTSIATVTNSIILSFMLAANRPFIQLVIDFIKPLQWWSNRYDLILAYALYILSFLACFFIIRFIVRRGQYYKWIRNRLFSVARFEGLWFQRVGIPERPHALSWIKFDDVAKRWIYDGYALDRDWKPVARWTTHSMYFDESDGRWFFEGTAVFLNYCALTRTYNPESGKHRVVAALDLHEYTAQFNDLDPTHFEDVKVRYQIQGVVADINTSEREKDQVFDLTLDKIDHLYGPKKFFGPKKRLSITDPSESAPETIDFALLKNLIR